MWSSRAVAFAEEKRKCLVYAVFHQWAFVVEKRKSLALFDRIDPYQHLDTDDDDDYDHEFSDWPDDKFYEVVKIRLPKAAG